MSHGVQLSTPLRVAQALVQGAPDPAVLFDHSFEVVYLNSSLASRIGAAEPQPADPSGARLCEQVFANAEQVVDQAGSCLQSGKPTRLPRLKSCNEPHAELELTLLPVSAEQGAVVGLVGWMREGLPDQRQQPLQQQLARERAKAEELARRLDQQAAELTRAMEQLSRLSRSDTVTGLLNRVAFSELAAETLKLAQRHRRTAAILLCDIDGLKAINESRGYPAADALIGAVAHALSEGLRSSDVVARTGGGEFAVLLAETTLDGVPEAAGRCCRAVRELPVATIVPGHSEPLTISVGVAVFPQDGDTVDTLLSRAATALQQAKGSERGSVATADANTSGGVVRPGDQRDDASTVLLVDIDASRAKSCADRLAAKYSVVDVASAERALANLNYRSFDAVVACQDVGGEDGQRLLQKALTLSPNTARVLLVENEADYLRLAASDGARVQCFIARQDYPDQLDDALAETLLRRRLGGTRVLSAVHPTGSFTGVQAEALEQILAEEALDFLFQPIVRATHRQVIGFEALCRPQHPSLSSPVELFEVALQLGVLWELGRLARRKLASRIAQLPPDALVFVNLHPAEVGDHELLEGERHLRRHAQRVVFEIPLRSALPNPSRFRDQVRILREHGYGLALDEPGKGYGCLSSLSLYQPRFLKLGGALMTDLERSEAVGSLLKRLLEASRSARVELICERLETAGQVRLATRAGVPLLQGFALGEPQPYR